jgi:DNA-binding transcriptional ArsR family regulator
MPFGIIVVKWDNRLGAVLEARFPEHIRTTDDQIMKIYTAHAMGEAAAGFMSMRLGNLNVASYYGGWELNYYVALLLTLEENADDYEDGLAEIAAHIFAKLENEAYKAELEDLYNKLTRFPTLSEEQKMSVILSDPVRLNIIERLIEEGNTTISDLEVWLKHKLDVKAIELYSFLSPLIKNGLVTTQWVEGLPSQCVFLIRDVFIARVPARGIVKKAKSGELGAEVASDYMDEVKNFFRDYVVSPEDTETITKILADPDAYDVLVALRENILPKGEIHKLLDKKKSVVDSILDALDKAGFTMELRIEKKAYVALKTDVKIMTFFPEYLVEQIGQQYNDQVKPPRMLLWHLKALRDSYPM